MRCTVLLVLLMLLSLGAAELWELPEGHHRAARSLIDKIKQSVEKVGDAGKEYGEKCVKNIG